jgi:hypothetical protein
MIEKVKWYLVEYGIKKYAPIAAMAAISAGGTFLAAHAGILEQYGITYTPSWPFVWAPGDEPSGPCILWELSTLSATIAGLIVTAATVAFRAGQAHTTGTPVVPGGNRAGDPPAANPPKESL